MERAKLCLVLRDANNIDSPESVKRWDFMIGWLCSRLVSSAVLI